MPLEGFEPADRASERPQSHNLESATTGISDAFVLAKAISRKTKVLDI
jgi:hypothetical protein